MDIKKNENRFIPVLKLYYALISEISSIDNNPDGTVTVNFNAGKDWKEFYATRDTIKFSEEMKDVDQGVVYNQSINFSNPGDDIINNRLIEEISQYKIIIKVVLKNGNKLMGDTDRPVLITFKNNNGDYKAARDINIKTSADFSAPYIS